MERLHICVRRTLPWHDEAAVEAALVPEMRPVVELWNATFNLRYPAFRLRIAQIARENFGRIEDATLTSLAETPPGALVVPVDDDDWFSPEIGRRLLAEREPSLHGYHWNRYILETPRRRRRWPWARRRRAADTSPHTCGSNNYAVLNLPELAVAIASHVTASEIFDAGPGRVKHVGASLSLQCRNLASRSALGSGRRSISQVSLAEKPPSLSRDALIEKYQAHRALYDRLRLPSEVAWAQPSVGEIAELMHELRLR